MFKSDAYQDQFVHRILSGKRDGYFIDIGSCGAISSNNTYVFESFNWRGICVEIEKSYAHTYSSRRCKFINDNALKLDYRTILQQDNAPKTIDYLSVDIDELSLDALKLLPHDEYQFSVITIEHDGYIYGDKYRNQQREFLKSLGYHLFAGNVRVPDAHFRSLSGLNHLDNNGFEDWWTHPSLNKNDVSFSNIFPENVLSAI